MASIIESEVMAKKHKSENWDDFRYFLAVARAATLSGAAEKLGTEHTTVARHISALEEGLKIRLFHKSNAGYELTPEGEKVLDAAESMESIVLSYKSEERDAGQICGVVRVGAPDGFGSVFLAPRMAELTKRHPNLEVEIYAAARVFSLSKREADIGISLATAEHLRVASRRLTDYRLHIYATRQYLDAAPAIRTQRDLGRHPFVGYVEDLLFAPQLDFSTGLEVELASRLRSTNLLTQVHTVLGGKVLGILPAYIASSFPALMPVLSDQVNITRSFYMHVHEDHRKAAHIREVAKFIAEQVDANRSLFL
ncbi:LysR family transcriptional regulator [Pseudomonas sp. NPDC089554]|uniref:LysR family transcriptional regulator n=1 Tax=Pseudomonas sp. NPDC089554 TaxID=3390653 RepID=UPI003D04A6DB